MRKNDLDHKFHFKVVDFDPNKEYPSSEDLYYECRICMGIFLSLLAKMLIKSDIDAWSCDCGNLVLNVDEVRISANEADKLIIYSAKTKL